MRSGRYRTSSSQKRLFLAAVLGAILLCLHAHVSRAADPPRMKRSDAFLGIHFDFHAGEDCDRVGAQTTREMVELVIDKVQPDYIQIDCKGHRGYSSYPTKVGNPAPGFVGDPLRVWRDVTRERGIALFMHYSGVWDYHAVSTHPQWAAVNADGKPNNKATSVFGPYVDMLMIPQLRELAGEYAVDGNRGAGTAHLYLARGAAFRQPIDADDLEEQEMVMLSRGEMAEALQRGEFKVLPWATAVALALARLDG